jgi:hypothetical protein
MTGQRISKRIAAVSPSATLAVDAKAKDLKAQGENVIGFGAGASRVDTEAHVYYGPGRRKLLDFGTHADSGKMPGAAATMGAGDVVEGGVTTGMAATNSGLFGRDCGQASR